MHGDELKKARKAARMSQRQLGALVGINPSYISQLESGARGEPSKAIVNAFARVFKGDADIERLASVLPPDETELLRLYRKLRPSVKQYKLEELRFYVDRVNK